MPSATLTWFNSGLGTKTGTGITNVLADLVTLINSKSGDANFSWTVASSNTATSPYYVVMKRKDASAGRILLLGFGSAPAGNNAAILDQAPATGVLYGAYFPAGNVDSPSNLTAASGTIMGDDTGAVKVWAQMPVGSTYGANVQPFYFDSSEAVLFGFQNPAVAAGFMAGAGKLLVDGNDNAYDAVFSLATTATNNFGGAGVLGWQTTKPNAGSGTQCIRTNYGSSDRVYFAAWVPSATWAASAPSSTDILTDTSAAKAWFVTMQLLGQTKGEGFVLKLRQIGYGSGTTGAFTPYNITGPSVAARQFNAATAGGNAYPWITNFKL